LTAERKEILWAHWGPDSLLGRIRKREPHRLNLHRSCLDVSANHFGFSRSGRHAWGARQLNILVAPVCPHDSNRRVLRLVQQHVPDFICDGITEDFGTRLADVEGKLLDLPDGHCRNVPNGETHGVPIRYSGRTFETRHDPELNLLGTDDLLAGRIISDLGVLGTAVVPIEAHTRVLKNRTCSLSSSGKVTGGLRDVVEQKHGNFPVWCFFSIDLVDTGCGQLALEHASTGSVLFEGL